MTDQFSNKGVAYVLRKIVKSRVDTEGAGRFGRSQIDTDATLAATRLALIALADVLDPPVGVETETVEAGEVGPENSREEVVGTSTCGKSKNSSSVGFSGGRPNGKLLDDLEHTQ